MAVARGEVVTIDEAVHRRRSAQERGATFGVCHGCFDILHAGHVHHLEQAANRVDVLLVSVTAAVHIDKGSGRPIFDDASRVAVLRALGMVDLVVLNLEPTAAGLLERIKPDFYFKGADYAVSADPRVTAESDMVRLGGGQVAFTDAAVFDSSSRAAMLLTAQRTVI